MKLTDNYEKRLPFQIKRLLFQNGKQCPSRCPSGLHNTTRSEPLSIRANRAKFGFCTIQKKKKKKTVQKTSFCTIIGILQCKNRDCPAGIENFGRSAGVVFSLQPTDHFSATSLKILFARIDRGSDRVVLQSGSPLYRFQGNLFNRGINK
jgi:hypothetical protein